MNLIGINQTFDGDAYPTDEEIQRVINKTHELGGLAVVNHIPWSTANENRLIDHPSLEQLIDWGIDYVEIVNEEYFDYQSYWVAKERGIGIISGFLFSFLFFIEKAPFAHSCNNNKQEVICIILT
jgi:hypothetical protein